MMITLYHARVKTCTVQLKLINNVITPKQEKNLRKYAFITEIVSSVHQRCPSMAV